MAVNTLSLGPRVVFRVRKWPPSNSYYRDPISTYTVEDKWRVDDRDCTNVCLVVVRVFVVAAAADA